jgi:DNA invertase Pin-like site-specific DNA recombinase
MRKNCSDNRGHLTTSQQGRSGLGIDAQRKALEQFAATEGLELVNVFVEIETGKGADALDRRPQCESACKKDPL